MKTLKTIKIIAIAILFLGLNSCDSDDVEVLEQQDALATKRIENLHAPADVRDYTTGEIISEGITKYFNFSVGEAVTESEDWDIAFKGTKIIVNSGIHGDTDAAATVVVGTFNGVVEAPADTEFKVDTEIVNAIASGSGNGWYNYNPTTHFISPIAGRVIIIRTHDNKYAKMEILSYYKNQTITPSNGDDHYYTFNYIYQTNGTKKF